MEERFQQFIHGSLKSRRRVVEPKGHNAILVVSSVGTEGGLGNVLCGHANLVEPLAQVKFREVEGGTELVEEFINGGHGELVLDCNGIECTIINATSPTTILFLHKEDRGGEGVVAESDEVGVEH